jgi:hypothetical protein
MDCQLFIWTCILSEAATQSPWEDRSPLPLTDCDLAIFADAHALAGRGGARWTTMQQHAHLSPLTAVEGL